MKFSWMLVAKIFLGLILAMMAFFIFLLCTTMTIWGVIAMAVILGIIIAALTIFVGPWMFKRKMAKAAAKAAEALERQAREGFVIHKDIAVGPGVSYEKMGGDRDIEVIADSSLEKMPATTEEPSVQKKVPRIHKTKVKAKKGKRKK